MPTNSTNDTSLQPGPAVSSLYTHIVLPFAFFYASLVLFNKWTSAQKSKVRTTPLNGPASTSLFFGLYKDIQESEDPGVIYEAWSQKYGPAFCVPGGFGSSRIIICDPQANAHFYSKETFGYVQTGLSKIFIERLFGRGLLWAEGESHRRQRKALSPAFSNAAIRRLTPVFYDSAYKMKEIWENILTEATGEVTIDVQNWMNHISLDSIGVAGFGHDFHAISRSNEGATSPVVQVFESFGSGDTSTLSHLVFLLAPVMPFLYYLPTDQNRMIKNLRATMKGIADDLLERNRKARVGEDKGEEKSIIGLLIKAESTSSSLSMSQEEILAQMNVLLLAGYETTSISLTWALIELSRQPEKQQRLRDELFSFTNSDPSFDQLSTGLPYLDAVTQEVLRLHPPVMETTRVAAEDDIIPFSSPIITASGERLQSLVVRKGTVITSPIRYINRAEELWGRDSKEFVPERWLATSEEGDVSNEERLGKAKEIQGYRHILTFSDGPRTCLGKSLALSEFKAVLSVLIRSYQFELPHGLETKILKHPSILPRPKVEGEAGAKVPLIIRRVE